MTWPLCKQEAIGVQHDASGWNFFLSFLFRFSDFFVFFVVDDEWPGVGSLLFLSFLLLIILFAVKMVFSLFDFFCFFLFYIFVGFEVSVLFFYNLITKMFIYSFIYEFLLFALSASCVQRRMTCVHCAIIDCPCNLEKKEKPTTTQLIMSREYT